MVSSIASAVRCVIYPSYEVLPDRPFTVDLIPVVLVFECTHFPGEPAQPSQSCVVSALTGWCSFHNILYSQPRTRIKLVPSPTMSRRCPSPPGPKRFSCPVKRDRVIRRNTTECFLPNQRALLARLARTIVSFSRLFLSAQQSHPSLLSLSWLPVRHRIEAYNLACAFLPIHIDVQLFSSFRLSVHRGDVLL